MYVYDQIDRQFVHERVAEFRDQVARRLRGELTEDEFRPLRLRNGLYLQLHAYMFRIAIPYGTLTPRQLRGLAAIARKYDRATGHFTTRQNLQLNWMKLEEVPDALADLADLDMHALQTSGNSVRNITADHWAGVAPDEVADPRITAELLRQWFAIHPEFSYLPRKFKFAVTGSPADRAATRLHDIGLILKRDPEGRIGYEVLVGGGLGRTPMVAKTIREFLPEDELLPYLEAILRVYNLAGRRDNLFKSRIKILVHEIGAKEMARRVEAEFAQYRGGRLEEIRAERDRIAAFFPGPDYAPEDPDPLAVRRRRATDPAFARWVRTNVFPQRVLGYAIVEASLKPPGQPTGDATSEQMEAFADLAETFSRGELRISHAQNLLLPHVRRADLPAVFEALTAIGFATPNINRIGDIIACPGLDFCSLANARSIPVAQRLGRRFADYDLAHGLGELKIKISGCINACGHHHIGHIGLLGVDKQGEEFYQITLGGSEGADAALGRLIGPAVSSERVVDVVDEILDTYIRIRTPGERFLDTVRRVGIAPFKERAYAEAA